MTCAAVVTLRLVDVVVDAGDDGVVSPGESLPITMTLAQTSPRDFFAYPGVAFEADSPEVTFGANPFWLFGIVGCGMTEIEQIAYLGDDIAPGTEIEITASAAMLNMECAGTDSVVFSVSVE